MTNQEMIDKIVEKSGITREQAEQALEMHSWDLLDAMIYVEQNYKNKTENTSSVFSSFSDAPKGTESSTQNFEVNEQKRSAEDKKSFGITIQAIVNFLTVNGLTIYHNEREITTIPLIVWAILFFSSISSLVVVMLVSMLFNVRYSFSGKLSGSKANKALFEIYTFVQSIKRTILS